jgi:nucleoid DNA-binding protein
MNKAELLNALQRQTKLRPTHVKRVVDAIFDPVDGVISRQIKRGGK